MLFWEHFLDNGRLKLPSPGSWVQAGPISLPCPSCFFPQASVPENEENVPSPGRQHKSLQAPCPLTIEFCKVSALVEIGSDQFNNQTRAHLIKTHQTLATVQTTPHCRQGEPLERTDLKEKAGKTQHQSAHGIHQRQFLKDEALHII